LLAIGELARQRAAVERAFPPHEIAGLPGGFPRAGSIDRLADDAPRHRRILLEKRAKLVVDDGFDDALDLGVAKLGLCLSLELRPRNLDTDHRRQTLANVVAGD